MTTPSIDALRSAVNLIDGMSQDAFSRIRGLCCISLLAMEQPGRPVPMEDLAQILLQIQLAADDAENTINVEAERVGCNYQDEPLRRRADARIAWIKAFKDETA